MPVLAMAIPVPPGKTTALEQHIAEAVEHEEFEETLKGFGITHESWHIQETPQGDLLILVFQSDNRNPCFRNSRNQKSPSRFCKSNLLRKLLALICLNHPLVLYQEPSLSGRR